MKKIPCEFAAGLIAACILIDTTHAQPKVSAANRETIRIMRTIKIPPPYTPVYQPMTWQQYVPSADTMPDYSPKVGPVQPFSIPKSTTVAPSALPVTATNAASVSATNVPVVDKTVKTPASAEKKEKEKSLNLEKK